MLIGNVHVIRGDAERLPEVLALLEENGIRVRGNPDVYVRDYRHFGIDEARELRERATRRAIGGAKDARRVFIVVSPIITGEAQNALLKTLEEAPGNALFIFVVPSPHILLPTVRSRAQMLDLPADVDHTGALVDARKFLSSTPERRLDMLKVLLEKGDDEKRDIAAIVRFLSSLESLLAKDVSPKTRSGIEALYRARTYVGDKGALVRPLLEQVALLSPRG